MLFEHWMQKIKEALQCSQWNEDKLRYEIFGVQIRHLLLFVQSRHIGKVTLHYWHRFEVVFNQLET